MFKRSITPSKTNSFFLFGPRGTGKTTYLQEFFRAERTFWINLLDPAVEDEYAKRPSLLAERLTMEKRENLWVVIDEIQKVPRLLDVVHQLIETKKFRFALTGSSARKLRRGASNLLAGRAFVYDLFPLTHRELLDDFSLEDVLAWGSLPRVCSLENDEERMLFLESYCHTYLKEEILVEQIIRQVDPFRLFLEVAAQMNGQPLNFSKIADDIGVDSKTVRAYYQILEDTLLGFFLPAYHRSIRKQQLQSPKFFLFDCGVKRALERCLDVPLKKGTYAFGQAFEHLVLLELFRLNTYTRKNYRLSYLLTKDGAEIDLIIERPGKPLALVEIKSADQITERHLATLERFANDLSQSEAFCLCRETQPRKVGKVEVLPWIQGLERIGLTPKKKAPL